MPDQPEARPPGETKSPPYIRPGHHVLVLLSTREVESKAFPGRLWFVATFRVLWTNADAPYGEGDVVEWCLRLHTKESPAPASVDILQAFQKCWEASGGTLGVIVHLWAKIVPTRKGHTFTYCRWLT